MKFVRTLLPLITLSMVRASAVEAAFDGLLAKENLWTLNQDAFEAAAPQMGFRWTSAARDSARTAAETGLTLFDRPIYELVARFEGGKLGLITASFYARGDAGDMNMKEARFNSLVLGTVEAVTKATGVRHTVRGKKAASAAQAEGLVWQTAKSQFLLEYSFTKELKSKGIPFRAEFVRLEIRPLEKRVTMLITAGVARPIFNGPQHVERRANGDVCLKDVPMVDQGEKGYCVVASTERVMRYYGGDVDANELAQVANTSAESGTSLGDMLGALKKVVARLRMRLREHEKLDVKTLLELMKEYNRAAKRVGESPIADPGPVLDVARIYAGMKAPVLKAARMHNQAEFGRFEKEVQARIDAGVPLLWAVQLGLVSEKEIPQASGGHMRLIIGYNTKTQEIIYSDSWGAGHERKKMKTDDAWTITTALMTIEPTT